MLRVKTLKSAVGLEYDANNIHRDHLPETPNMHFTQKIQRVMRLSRIKPRTLKQLLSISSTGLRPSIAPEIQKVKTRVLYGDRDSG